MFAIILLEERFVTVPNMLPNLQVLYAQAPYDSRNLSELFVLTVFMTLDLSSFKLFLCFVKEFIQ